MPVRSNPILQYTLLMTDRYILCVRGVFNVLLLLSKQNEVQRKSVRHFQLHLVMLGVSKSALIIVPIWYKEAYTDKVNQGGRGVKYQKCTNVGYCFYQGNYMISNPKWRFLGRISIGAAEYNIFKITM